MLAERIIIVDAVADAFAEQFKAKVSPLGTLVDAKTVAHCQSLVDDALAKGAQLLMGSHTTQNVLRQAHVISGVTQDMKLFRDESFGPVVGLIQARDEAQVPFGGAGASGYGRFGGKAGIDRFTELRWITVETQPEHLPI